jgi:uncharacterized protein YkwD
MTSTKFRAVLRRTTAAIATCGFLASAAPALAAPQPCKGADALPAEVGSRATADTTLCLVNRERASRGLRPLRASAALARAARGHANDMVANRYFSHTSRSGSDFFSRIERAGYGGSRTRIILAGENLAWGSGELATPVEIVRAWMRSPGHRSNILRRGFHEIGIAAVNGTPVADAPVGATYATSFGNRAAR